MKNIKIYSVHVFWTFEGLDSGDVFLTTNYQEAKEHMRKLIEEEIFEVEHRGKYIVNFIHERSWQGYSEEEYSQDHCSIMIQEHELDI